MAKQSRGRHVTLRLDVTLRDGIESAAKERGCSVSQLVRDAVAGALEICPTCGATVDRNSRHATRTSKPRAKEAA